LKEEEEGASVFEEEGKKTATDFALSLPLRVRKEKRPWTSRILLFLLLYAGGERKKKTRRARRWNWSQEKKEGAPDTRPGVSHYLRTGKRRQLTPGGGAAVSSMCSRSGSEDKRRGGGAFPGGGQLPPFLYRLDKKKEKVVTSSCIFVSGGGRDNKGLTEKGKEKRGGT